jgi:hypothetical protein
MTSLFNRSLLILICSILLLLQTTGCQSLLQASYGPDYYSSEQTDSEPQNYHSPSTVQGRTIYTGPRGGQYYINGNGNKTYITPPSTIYNNQIYTGPRGGQYYINQNGNKTYIKR